LTKIGFREAPRRNGIGQSHDPGLCIVGQRGGIMTQTKRQPIQPQGTIYDELGISLTWTKIGFGEAPRTNGIRQSHDSGLCIVGQGGGIMVSVSFDIFFLFQGELLQW
jgi:hypothetical protein